MMAHRKESGQNMEGGGNNMNDEIIKKMTKSILAIKDHYDDKNVHEFLCACDNAKALVQNKLNASLYRQSLEASVRNMLNILKPKG